MADRPRFDPASMLEAIRKARREVGRVMHIYAACREFIPAEARDEIDGELKAWAAEIAAATVAAPRTGPAS
jgi:hypothetical protein